MKIDAIKNVTVIGAGLMGHGIAQLYALAGYSVRLMDTSKETLASAEPKIKSSLSTLKQKGLVTDEEITACMGRISLFTDLADAVIDADLVVEAVPEVIEIKEVVYKKLHEVCKPETIFATNTSGLDVFGLIDESRAPYLIATHFFAPAQIIPLVEVCPGPETREDVVAITEGLLKKIGKRPVVMKQYVPSFIVNRIQNYISMAVFEMLNNNWATPEEIDLAVKTSLGIRLPIVGVVQSLDFTGLDLVNDIMKSNGMSMPFIEEKVEKGHLGAKTSKGFYDYDKRSEQEIVEKRDLQYLKMVEYLDEIEAYESI